MGLVRYLHGNTDRNGPDRRTPRQTGLTIWRILAESDSDNVAVAGYLARSACSLYISCDARWMGRSDGWRVVRLFLELLRYSAAYTAYRSCGNRIRKRKSHRHAKSYTGCSGRFGMHAEPGYCVRRFNELVLAYRPVAYQDHLREVWDIWDAVRNRQETECQAVRDEARAEFQSHGLLLTQRPAAGSPNAPHARGVAIDATLTRLPAGETPDTVAAFCSMHRPWPANDPVHYQPQ